MGKKFNNGEQIVPCVVASEPDDDGVCTVFAAEGDSSDVKAFPARKAGDDNEADYVRA